MPIIKRQATDDTYYRGIFSWATRVGAAPKFGTRPIGWYQQHQMAVLDLIEYMPSVDAVRFRAGYVQVHRHGAWYAWLTPDEIFRRADTYVRTGSYGNTYPTLP